MRDQDKLVELASSHQPTVASAKALAGIHPQAVYAYSEPITGSALRASLPAISSLPNKSDILRITSLNLAYAADSGDLQSLLDTGERRVDALLPWVPQLVHMGPETTTDTLRRANWPVDMLIAAYKHQPEFRSALTDATSAIRRYWDRDDLPLLIMASDVADHPHELVNYLLAHPFPSRARAFYAIGQLATSKPALEYALKRVAEYPRNPVGLLLLASVPTFTNRSLADRLINAVLDHDEFTKVPSLIRSAYLRNVYQNPFISDRVIARMDTLTAKAWYVQLDPEYDRPVMRSIARHDFEFVDGTLVDPELTEHRGFDADSLDAARSLATLLDTLLSRRSLAPLQLDLILNLMETYRREVPQGTQHEAFQTKLSSLLHALPTAVHHQAGAPFGITPYVRARAYEQHSTPAPTKERLSEVFERADVAFGDSVRSWEEFFSLVNSGLEFDAALAVING